MLADQTLEKLIKDYKFDRVLDIGFGDGEHSKAFAKAGKKVTALDYNPRTENIPNVEIITTDFMNFHYIPKFPCIWCSHVLEHQPNPIEFLERIQRFCWEGGIVAITVPPMKHEIVGGHLTWWNAGKLLYTMILAGFDCSKASVSTYGYNVSVIVKNKPIEGFDWGSLNYNKHDIKKLEQFFPMKINGLSFNGQIKEINWK